MTTKTKRPVIGMTAPVSITAGEAEGGNPAGPARFETTFYTGGPLNIDGWDLPVVVDLAGLNRGNVLVANLDHDRTKRVGNFDVANDGKTLVARGTATAKTAARDEVVGSAMEGYQWQSSLEVNPHEVEEVKAGKSVTVNGQTFSGPLYVTRKGTLKGFGFVSHGADDNTTVSIAASAASTKGNEMRAEVKAWAESMGVNVDEADADQLAAIEANYAGRSAPAVTAASTSGSPFEKRKVEAKRRNEIRAIADRFIERREHDLDYIETCERLCEHAVEAKMSIQDFRNEMYETMFAEARPTGRIHEPVRGLTNRVLEAALCQHGRLSNIDKHFSDQELQMAHDRFRGAIGLNQFILLCAEAAGHRSDSASKVTIEAQRAAFRLNGYRQQHAAGFSTIDIANIVSATANKFVMEGWNSVDQVALRLAAIQPVSNFQTRTTVSLTDSVQYQQVGSDGEIKHGTLDELTYTVQADTYARMLAITRKDLINDDMGALTGVPRKLGNGAIKKLNDIFWAEFLNGVTAAFFATANSNINEGIATMTTAGLAATETIFMNQTNPDGTPLGVMPEILVVPTALKSAAFTLMSSERLIDGSSTAAQGDGNIWRGRFRVESSPYISNSTYTGYTSTAWWMLASPSVLPVIAIAALNGRVEPTVETADADFNVLGIQMRGYSDVGVNMQEYRGGVHADGGGS